MKDDRAIATSSKDKVSKPFLLEREKTVKIVTGGDAAYFFATISFATKSTTISVGSSVTEVVTKRTTGTALQEFSYTATDDCYIVLCGLDDDSTVVSFEGYVKLPKKQDVLVSGSNIKTINGHAILGSGDLAFTTIIIDDLVTGGKMNALSAEQGKVIGNELFDAADTPSVQWVSGFVIDGLLIKSSSQDKVSKPFLLEKGKTVNFTTKGDGNYFFTTIAIASASTNIVVGSSVTTIISKRVSGRAEESYSYTATNDCYIVLCGYDDDTTIVSFEGYTPTSKITALSSKVDTLTGDVIYDLSSFKQTSIIDGTFYGGYKWGTNGGTVNYNGIIIPCNNGDVFEIKAKDDSNTSCAFVKSIGEKDSIVDFALPTMVMTISSGMKRSVVASNKGYLWIYKTRGGNDVSPEYVKKIKNLGDYINPLFGKKLTVNGDSICYGAGFYGGYAFLVAQRNSMIHYSKSPYNVGVGGGTITAETYSGGTAKHWICRTINNMLEDADYAIIEGGVNDGSYQIQLGSLTSGYNNTLDDTTFYGACESMLKQLVTRYKGKKYGYIIAHQCSDKMKPNGEYYNAVIECCKKWGVPYLDLASQVPPFGYLASAGAGSMRTLADDYTADTTSSGHGDGWHPNEEGYLKYYVSKIEAWMKTL